MLFVIIFMSHSCRTEGERGIRWRDFRNFFRLQPGIKSASLSFKETYQIELHKPRFFKYYSLDAAINVGCVVLTNSPHVPKHISINRFFLYLLYSITFSSGLQ